MRPRLAGKWRLASRETLSGDGGSPMVILRYDGDVLYGDEIVRGLGKRAVIKQGMRSMSRSFLKETAHMDRERWIRNHKPEPWWVVKQERIYCQPD